MSNKHKHIERQKWLQKQFANFHSKKVSRQIKHECNTRIRDIDRKMPKPKKNNIWRTLLKEFNKEDKE